MINNHSTHFQSEYDVVVVGARVAGASTAMLLARSGLSVLAVERAPEGADTISTHALMRGGVMQLVRWGLLDRIIEAGTPAIRTATYTYAGLRRPIAIKSAFGVGAFYAPRRTLLDQTLVDAARVAGADVCHSTRVTGLIRRRNRVAGIRLVGPMGRHDIRARLVIGADGVRSTVANEVAAEASHVASAWSGVTYGYWSGVSTSGYEWVFHPEVCSGAIPTNDGLMCVFAAAEPHRIGRGGVDVIRRAAALGDPSLAERLDSGRAPTATRTWSGIPGFLRVAHGPGWALVGDAGSFRDPITAHGLTDAMRDAELLSRAVIAGLCSGTVALDEALAEYEAIRDRLSLPLLLIGERIASYDWDDDEIDHLVRSMNSAMAGDNELLSSLDDATEHGGVR